MKIYKKNVLNFIILLIISIILYYSIIPNDYLKYSIVIILIGYYGIFDIRYALLLFIIFILIENNKINNNSQEDFSSFNKEHRAKIFNAIDESIVNISNVVNEEMGEEEQQQNYDNLFKNEPKTFSEMIENIDDKNENGIEPFVDLNAITGTFLKVGETIHNNNNINKIKKNIRRSVRKVIKTLQEEDEDDEEKDESETSSSQETKIKKQNSQYKKEKINTNKEEQNTTTATSSDNEVEEESDTDTNMSDNEADEASNDGIEGFTTDMKNYMELKKPKSNIKKKKNKKSDCKNKWRKYKDNKITNKFDVPKQTKGKYNIFEHLQNSKKNEDKIDELQDNINDKMNKIGDFISQLKKK